MFKDKNEIISLNNQADDSGETKELIKHFKKLKSDRIPFYLNEKDFELILKWKLRSQYKRQSNYRKLNNEEIIKSISKVAFGISHRNINYETKLKINLLCTIRGVGIPVASAILTLCYPNEYGVIDFRIWRQLFTKKKSYYSLTDYLKYLTIIKELASMHRVSTQEIDLALWQKDLNEYS